MREQFEKSIESLGSLKDKVETIERQAKLLEGLLVASEAREAKLKEELQASQSTVQGLQAQLKVGKEKLSKAMKYATDLETCLANATSKGMY